ncbi:barttin isoform X1 [Mugil cephalus]|uniref:barttin isoform X1 n=1 Tax=Mugil cephalus TaxID=48193 RepID=UPI001FB7A12E|nr:barttin isoform X1 [Mugil cephalus]
MTEGKPYRYGLIVAGLSVAAVGLFIMTQERPHVYATMCALGIVMVCVGTAWSLCQCYPKVIVAPRNQEKSRADLVRAAAEGKDERYCPAHTHTAHPKWATHKWVLVDVLMIPGGLSVDLRLLSDHLAVGEQ